MGKKDIKQNNTALDKINIEAKQRVAELTGDILPPVTPPVKKVEEVKPTLDDMKNVEYLTEQLDILTQSNTELIERNAILEQDYQKIFTKYQELVNNDGVSDIGIGSNNLELKIVDLYRELYDVLNGIKYGEKYDTMNIKVLMKKLVEMFPFIRDYGK